MKRIIAALVCAILLAGCAENGGAEQSEIFSESVQTEETTVTESETTRTETTTAETEPERDYNEQWLIDFMEHIKSGCKTEFHYYDQGNVIRFYDFWDSVVIDSYTYEPCPEYDGYKVTMTCSESGCDIIPVGVSEWYFGRCIFCPFDEVKMRLGSIYYDKSVFSETVGIAYHAAYDFTFAAGVFEADSEWFESCVLEDIDLHWLYHAYNPYITLWEYNEETGKAVYYDVTVEEYIEATKKLYNISPKPESVPLGEDGYVLKSCGHGGTWLYESLADYEESDSEVKVTLDYYGDEYYFYAVIRAEYTFSKNEDGTITLQKIEKLFDKGYELAYGTI